VKRSVAKAENAPGEVSDELKTAKPKNGTKDIFKINF